MRAVSFDNKALTTEKVKPGLKSESSNLKLNFSH